MSKNDISGAIEKVWAIVENAGQTTDKGAPIQRVMKIFMDRQSAIDALFPPYTVVQIEIDTTKVLEQLSARLTPQERYVLSCYNEIGLQQRLGL